MTIYGATFLPVSWSYPSEIIPAESAVYANIFGWIATTIVVSVPPIVTGAMPNHNAYPLFFFFGFYGIFGTIYIYMKLVESKGRTYEEIVKEY
jgi:MFS family permease